jgi:hypothetical protein
MTKWNLKNDDDLIDITDTYFTLNYQMIRDEITRGETRPQSARRQTIARQMGLTEHDLLTAVRQGTEIKYQRETANMTEGEREDRDRAWEAIITPLIDEATTKLAADRAEIDQIKRMFE